jgi:hypothetical protein
MKKLTAIIITICLVGCVQYSEHDKIRERLSNKISFLEKELQIEREKLSILTCESNIKHTDIWGDNGMSYGIAQFQERTFKELKLKAGKPKLSWKVQADQIWLLDWALRNGYGEYWTCYKGDL